MGNNALKVVTLTIFALILTVHAAIPSDDDRCLPVKYTKPVKADKPDLLIVEEVRIPNNKRSRTSICRIKNDDSEDQGQFVQKPGFPYNNNIDFDSKNNTIYKADYITIQSVNLNVKRDANVFYPPGYVFLGSTLGSVALDWVTKNLYVCHGDDVEIFNGTPKKILTVDEKNSEPIVKVFPNQGYLVVKTSRNTITRFDQNGKDPIVLYTKEGVIIRAVALDHYEQKIYWTEVREKTAETEIKSMNLNGEEVETLISLKDISFIDAKHLQVDKNYIYNVRNNNLLRIKKTDGSVDEDFQVTADGAEPALKGDLVSFAILNGNPQVIVYNHPCRNNNGGCEGFCVAIPGDAGKLTKECLE